MFGRKLTTKQAAAKVNEVVETLVSGLSGLASSLDGQIATLDASTATSNATIEELQAQVASEETEQEGMRALRTRIKKITSNLRTLLGEEPVENDGDSEKSS